MLKKILKKIIRGKKNEIKLYKNNLYSVLWEKAVLDSSKYVEKYLNDVLVFEQTIQIWDYTIQSISKTSAGVYLEFGVFKGNSINYFSNALPKYMFYGFDSFEGLAEDWKGHYLTKGDFNVDGKVPIVNPNVTLIKGWFNETLPKFILDFAESILIISCSFAISNEKKPTLSPWVRPACITMFKLNEVLPIPGLAAIITKSEF